MFDNKIVLITGGTGSIGTALTQKLLKTNVSKIRILSRDESKQSDMQDNFNDDRLRFLIGDVRDKERLSYALNDVDIVIHAAALKQVPVAEYNPFEAVKTNVLGAQNLIELCLEKNIEKVLAIGTDKAVSPFNTYGASKFLMERLFIAANGSFGSHNVKFMCVRYGNVLGSRGSIIPLFINKIKQGKKITITDLEMTRFNITRDSATDLIFRALKHNIGGSILIPKLSAYKVGILKDAVLELLNTEDQSIRIPVRPGEKYHELLISLDESRNVYQNDTDYLLYEPNRDVTTSLPNEFKKITLTESYSSNKVSILSKNELKEIILKENLI
jgi:UDP-N-acetylglucosamine 4,6-dehydratase